MRTRRFVNVVVIAVLAASGTACGGSGPEPTASPGTPTPSVAASTALVPTASIPIATPTSSATPSAASTPGPLRVGGVWAKPGPNARLTSYTVTLAARPTMAGTGTTTVDDVTFLVTAGDRTKTACTATRPDAAHVWTCKANLLALGVPPGRVSFTFDVHAVGVPAAVAPDGPRRVTYAVPPPRPTDTALVQLEEPDYETPFGNLDVLHLVRWSTPDGYADEFLVYETFECPRPSTEANSGKPCFTVGTPVDVALLELRGKASGDARELRLRLTEPECDTEHGTILLRARNAYGASVFAIVQSHSVIWVPPGEVVC